MTSFHAGLADIFEIPVDQISPGFRLTEKNWDSLAIISCVVLIDECFGMLPSGAELAACATVADLDALVSRAVAA